MFKTVTNLVINNRLDYDDPTELDHNNPLNRLRYGKCTNDDWCNYRNLVIKG